MGTIRPTKPEPYYIDQQVLADAVKKLDENIQLFNWYGRRVISDARDAVASGERWTKFQFEQIEELLEWI